jgi:hypothetical protein
VNRRLHTPAFVLWPLVGFCVWVWWKWTAQRYSDKQAVLLAAAAILLIISVCIGIGRGHGNSTRTLSSPATEGRLTFLLWFVPRDRREEISGDLVEEYQVRKSTVGRWSAELWYYRQLATSFWSLAWNAMNRRGSAIRGEQTQRAGYSWLAIGARVRVTHGRFEGARGYLVRATAGSPRLVVAVEWVNRVVAVEIDARCLERDV